MQNSSTPAEARKPMNAASQKPQQKKSNREKPKRSRLQLLKYNAGEPAKPLLEDKIRIPVVNGYQFIAIADIILIAGAGSQCILHTAGEPAKIVVSKTLKDMEELLSKDIFMRTQKSYIINRNHIKAFFREDGSYLLMSNGEKAYISTEVRPAIEAMMKAMDEAGKA
jgi:two-component system, LytTR family, response regulator